MFGKSKKKRDRSRSPMGNRKGGFKNQRNFVGQKPENRRFFNSDQPNTQPGQLVGLDPSLASNLNPYNLGPGGNQMAGMQQMPGGGGNQLQSNQLQANQLQTNQQMQANQMQNSGQLLNSGNLNSMNLNQPSIQSDFNRPPSSGQLNAPPAASTLPTTNNNANELEIIVMNRDQWPYCEMLEKRFRQETCLKFIDLGLFLSLFLSISNS